MPDNLKALQSAKVVLIPHGPAGESTFSMLVCSSKDGELVTNNCAGPISKPFVVGVANQLVEVEIGGFLAPFIGKPGATYLSVIAFTTPTTASDHIVGLRFGYEPAKPSGVATLAANTFTGTQTAPAFVGNGSGLTGVPFPAGAATLGANTFSGTQTAPAFAGSGAVADRRRQAGGEHRSRGRRRYGSGDARPRCRDRRNGHSSRKAACSSCTTSAPGNLFLGTSAGNFTMTGFARVNAAIGDDALSSNTSGGHLTSRSGTSALFNNTTGDQHSYRLTRLQDSAGRQYRVGAFALMRNEIGVRNVAVGSYAGARCARGFRQYLSRSQRLRRAG